MLDGSPYPHPLRLNPSQQINRLVTNITLLFYLISGGMIRSTVWGDKSAADESLSLR